MTLTFQGVQQHVLRTDREAAIQAAAHQPDGSPDHDWRRAGDGTTRALQTHLSLDGPTLAPVPTTTWNALIATAAVDWPEAAGWMRRRAPAPTLRI